MKEKGVLPVEVIVHYVCNYPQTNEGKGALPANDDSLCIPSTK